MELTRKQEEGLRIAVERYKAKDPYTCIGGYAGAGKSTLVRFIISALDINPRDVAYVAYTGKAAQVLQQKGNPNATTAHRLLYKSIPRKDGTFIHIPRESLPGVRLVVVDEISMLPNEMWELLLSHHIHVIACGDPYQLPPVVSSEDNHVLDHPHIFLDEIMRQAAESEIIRLSMEIRAGRTPKPFRGTEVNVVPKSDFVDGMLLWADQVLCGKNATRHELNTYYRRMIWGEDTDISTPLVGDRIVCLKNNWKRITGAGDALVNGATGKLTKLKIYPNPYLDHKCIIDFQPEVVDDCGLVDSSFHDLLIDWKLITTHEPTLNKENYSKFPWKLRPEQFDYGYVVTTWKAQGSEYDKVTFLAETVGRMDREMYSRYLYTGVTRASKRLTLII